VAENKFDESDAKYLKRQPLKNYSKKKTLQNGELWQNRFFGIQNEGSTKKIRHSHFEKNYCLSTQF
jgi:hypothetical protein